MTKRIFKILLCVIFATGSVGIKAQNQPNIIVILADDLGYGDLGSYGCEDIKTPNLDKMAVEGVRLTSFYANGPECTPTRAAFLTGRYQQRVGGLECAIGAGNVGRYDEAEWLSERHQNGLDPAFTVLPSALKKAGYATAIIGKWHLGYEKKFRPLQHGFDYSIGPIGYGGDYFYHVEKAKTIRVDDFTGSHNLAENDREIYRDGYYMTHLITKESDRWIGSQSPDQPFFLYIPYTAPHKPLQGPYDFKNRPLQGDEWQLKDRAKYAEMVEDMDKGIGEIFHRLRMTGQDKNTIVIFFSDNGATGFGDNGPFRGIKGQVFEGGIRVPCLVWWPENLEAGKVSDQLSASFDLTYSILKLAGANPENYDLDGADIIDHLLQGNEDYSRTLFWRKKRYEANLKAVRDGNLKYIINYKGDQVQEEYLFDLLADPSETNDLKDAQPKDLKKMKKLLQQWESEMKPQWLDQLKAVK